MTKVNLSQAKKKAEEAGLLGGGNVWKPKEGANVLRLVSELLEHPGEFKGPDGKVKKTFKWLCFILDRVDGEVKAYFMPNTVPHPPENWYIRNHWVRLGDLFVAFLPYMEGWYIRWTPGEIEEFAVKTFKLVPDARMPMAGRVYFIEEDTGSEDLDVQLEPKVDKYVALAEAFPYGSFQVLFFMGKYRRMSLPNRIGRFTEMLTEKRRGNQFLVCAHDLAIDTPLGAIWITPLVPTRFHSLSELPYGD